MGSYLSEPETEKFSAEEISELLACGSSSMQGWRVSQEDAHNCILDYDKNTSFFAVYDGHGGHEVAQYCSQKLPDYLKAMEHYKNGELDQALEEAFLGFDASIVTLDVVKVLKEIAKDKEADVDSDEDEENVNHLYEEATMPIEEVIGKYTSNRLARQDKTALLKDDKPSSPFLKAKSSTADGEGSSGIYSSSSGVSSMSASSSCQDTEVNSTSNDTDITQEKEKKHENGQVTTPVVESAIDSEQSENADIKAEGEINNGEKPTAIENGTPKKGKATVKTKGVDIPSPLDEEKTEPVRKRPRRTVQQLYAKLLDAGALPLAFDSDEDDDDDDNDETFEDPSADNAASSDDDADGGNTSLEDINSSEDADEEDEEEDEDEEDETLEDEDDVASAAFAKNMIEEPGSDSGCTAVVALLKDSTLYVANAGDSRCIVCRAGKAVEMSVDHKPEDQIERDRIVKAGGRVTADGRVNGGLNLSRAIGDHAYKQNTTLDAKEQMITALPDIKTIKIDETQDEFMVLACDGIWNFMSSQEVVDFVRPAIKNGTKLSKICEEMFDHCLAPNTMGDGTGCDNMTAIIVQFLFCKSNMGLKRCASDSEETDGVESTKRMKTEEAEDQPSTTST